MLNYLSTNQHFTAFSTKVRFYLLSSLSSNRSANAMLLTSNRSVPFVTTYATRASKAQLLTSNKSVPSSLRMPQGHQGLSSLRRTGPFLRHSVCHKGIIGSAPYGQTTHILLVSVFIAICTGRIFRGANVKVRFVPKPHLHAPLVSLPLGNRNAIS